MKAYGIVEVLAPVIRIYDSERVVWSASQLHAPANSVLKKEPRYPLKSIQISCPHLQPVV